MRWEEVFGGEADALQRPIEVDLGAGFGAFALELARRCPDRNIFAVEREGDRVDLICRKIAAAPGNAGQKNIKVLHLESAYTVEYLLPWESVAVIHLLFPDPWPKQRHHRRRIVTEGFLHSIWTALRPGGEFRFATDSLDYMDWTRERVGPALAEGRWEMTTFPPPDERPLTDFERTWSELGRPLNYLALRKIAPPL